MGAASTPSFSLRFRSARLRELVKELAARQGVSQNELIERAVEREVVLQGLYIAEDLAVAAARLRQMTVEQHAELQARAAREFASGEQGADPLRVRALHTVEATSAPDVDDPYGALAAFTAATRG